MGLMKVVDNYSMIIKQENCLKGIEIQCPGVNFEEVYRFLGDNLANSEKEAILVAFKENNGRKIYNLLKSFYPNTIEEVIWFYKIVCTYFFLNDSSHDVVKKINLLERAFRLNIGDWDKNPLNLHHICKSLWYIAKNDENVIQLCKKLCTVSIVGFNIAVCLAWGSTFRLLRRPIKMFRLYNFHELVDILYSKDMNSLKQNLNETYTLLQIVSFLLNIIVLRKSDENISAEYASYFNYKKEDLIPFKEWCLEISQMFDINMNNEIHLISLYTTLIYELIELDISYCLENILYDI